MSERTNVCYASSRPLSSVPQRCSSGVTGGHLEVVGGELQHVPQDIADDLGLLLDQDALIVQGIHHLWSDLQTGTESERERERERVKERADRSVEMYVAGNAVMRFKMTSCDR